ncbi:PAS domain S-box protein [Paenibacillus sepulcri]|uniref:histidine kinase n=2 Tax=Paenibacillus sepulcri TaxID=359917 RepID=A0ABS7BX28_9BACL|nr:PAS domain S-box protein [Paenibacillus sepulcri]
MAYPGKWGFYMLNDQESIIGSYIQNNQTEGYGEINSPTSVLSQTMTNNLIILEISGFNPLLFGKEPVGEIPKMTSAQQMAEHPVSFGSYHYRQPQMDERNILAASRGQNVFRYTTVQGKDVIKSFVKVAAPVPYVIGLVLDGQPLTNKIDEQRNNQIFISAILLIIVVFCSYWLSDILIRPIRSILWKINEVSYGRFDNSIEVKRKDELGQLAQRVNAMSKNLGIYMTKLKLAFEENRSMKEYLESFINHTTDAIHVVDLSGRITQVNRAFEQLFGYTADEATGHTLPLVPEHLHMEELQMMEGLKSGKHLTARETIRVNKSGEWIAVSVTTSPIRDKHGTIHAIASITRDMTGRNKMEELLRRSEKLTTVGQLAAGVAHEIRNPLTTLRGFLQLQLETNKLNTRHVDIMLSELDRINLIVGEFLILAKPQATRFEEKDVRFILGDVISLLDSQAHLCDIEFIANFNMDSCLISCEENQLKQVFINLLKNAIEAMPDGGEIQVSIDSKGSSEVSVSIIDEGIGIPEEMISKLGDPFFTGKDSGTGLGIMVSQRIIESHHGMMEIKSKVDVGTTVTITLPLIQKPREETSEDQPNHVQ